MPKSPDTIAAPHVRDDARLRYIDTLRGIAALLVVWLHGTYAFGRINSDIQQHGGWLLSVPDKVDVGHIGVVVFFAISGFVIPFSIKSDGPSPTASFLIKRFFRLFPAYWLSVPFAALANFWLWHTAFGARELVINLSMLQDLLGVPRAETPYWTLPVEWVFYFLCVALLWLGSLFDARRVGIVAMLLFAVFAVLLPAYAPGHRAPIGENAAFWFLNLSVMLWGALYRMHGDADPLRRNRFDAIVMWGLLAGYVALLPSIALASSAYMRNTLLTYVIGFAIFVVGTRFVRIETRLTDWVGRVSYSLYLFHVIVLMSASWWLLKQPEGSWWRSQALGTYLAAGALASLVVATIVYELIERPGIRLGHRLAARLNPSQPIASADARA